jgi:hypothetical protein
VAKSEEADEAEAADTEEGGERGDLLHGVAEIIRIVSWLF